MFKFSTIKPFCTLEMVEQKVHVDLRQKCFNVLFAEKQFIQLIYPLGQPLVTIEEPKEATFLHF